jgi:hypothetical protein
MINSDKLNKKDKQKNKSNIIFKNIFNKFKENIINDELKTEIIYPLYNEIYFQIYPYYITIVILMIIIILLLLLLTYLFIKK